MSDIKQAKEWAYYLSSIGWKVLKFGKNYTYLKKIPFLGTYIKIPRASWPVDFREVDKIAQSNRALLVKIDPRITLDDPNASSVDARFLQSGFKKDYWTLTIAKTLVVDLTKDEDDLLTSFTKDTRYEIRLAQKYRVKISPSDDIFSFYKLYQQTARRKGFRITSFKDIRVRFQAFKKVNKAVLLFASTENRVLAACMLLLNTAEKQASYHLAATSDSDRILHAPSLLVWQAIILAKKLGYKKFDFDGILDEQYRATKNWGGFSSFKKGFGGQEVSYLGSYLKWYHPVFRFFYSIAKTLPIVP